MHIGFIISVFPTLSETFVRNQVTGMIDLGHKVTVYCKKNTDERVYELRDVKEYTLENIMVSNVLDIPLNKSKRFKKAVKIVKKNWRTNWRQILESLNFFKYGKSSIDLLNLFIIAPYFGEKIDIMQCHFGHIAEQAVFLKKMKFPFKLQVMFHGFDIRLGIEEGSNRYKGLVRYANKVQAISSYNLKHLREFGFKESQIVMHPVGIDTKFFSLKAPSKTKNQHINILSVGRLVWEKGYSYGIKAVSELVKKHNLSITYNIIGEGECFDDLRKLVREEGLGKAVVFEGPKDRNEINLAMERADIFLLPSEAEALPVVIMEAQSKGLPVVASDVGSISDLVINGKTGYLVVPKDVDDLVIKIMKLNDEKETWKEMGARARRIIEKDYNIEKLNKKLLD